MTALTQLVERTTQAIKTDRWDQAEVEDAVEEFPRINDLAEKLGEMNKVGADLTPDLFLSLFKYDPRLNPPERVAHSHAINRAIMAELEQSEEWKRLREFTQADRCGSAMAAMHLADAVSKLYDRLKHLQETADRAQAAHEALEGLLNGADGDGEGLAPPEAVERAEQDLAEAEEQLAGALDGAQAAIGRTVRGAVREAAAGAEEDAAIAAAWGTTPGMAARMDAQERLTLAARMKNPRTRKIAEILGRMQNVSWGDKQKRLVAEPDELYGVTVGGDLNRLLPAEHANRSRRALRLDFLYRYTQRRLQVYELKRVIKEGRGPVIYVEDSSGSMFEDKYCWSKGFGLTLLTIARDEGRGFHAICFSSGAWTEYSFPTPASFSTERMLDYAEHGADGGTDVQGPLDRAIELIAEESDTLGFKNADIVLSTDGIFHVDPTWLARYLDDEARLGFHTYGVAIDCEAEVEPFRSICTGRVSEINDLASGENVRGLFGALR